MGNTGNRRTVAVAGEEALTLVRRLTDLQAGFEREHAAFHLEVEQRHLEMLARRNDAAGEIMARIGELCVPGEGITASGSPWVLHLEFFEEHGQAFLKEVESPAGDRPSLERMLTDPQGTRH